MPTPALFFPPSLSLFLLLPFLFIPLPSALYYNHPGRKAPPWKSLELCSQGLGLISVQALTHPSPNAVLPPHLEWLLSLHLSAITLLPGTQQGICGVQNRCSQLLEGHINLASAAAVFREGWPHRIISGYGCCVWKTNLCPRARASGHREAVDMWA